MVTSSTSPWFSYLRAVYGGDVTLPFDLRALRMFYKDTSEWRLRHPRPAVALPMASCSGRPRPAEWAHTTITARSYGLRRSTTQPQCAADVCRAWLEPDATLSSAFFPSVHHLALTHRTHYVEIRQLLSPPARPVADGGWLEVMRMDYSASSYEGVDGYGCWWFVLPGSGYFVSVGRTAVVANGTHMAEARAASEPLFAQFLGAGHRVTDIPTPRGDHKELLPHVAHALGYSSIQVLSRATETADMAGPFELVITSSACSTQRFPVRACVPIEVRTGARHDVPCVCNSSSPIFNCRGHIKSMDAPDDAPRIGSGAHAEDSRGPIRTSSRPVSRGWSLRSTTAARRPATTRVQPQMSYTRHERPAVQPRAPISRHTRPVALAAQAENAAAYAAISDAGADCANAFFLRMPCAGIANDLLVVLRAHAAAADAGSPLVLLPAFCEHVPWYSPDVWAPGAAWHWLGERWHMNDIFRPGMCDRLAPALHALVRNGSHPPTFGRLAGRVSTPTYLSLPTGCPSLSRSALAFLHGASSTAASTWAGQEAAPAGGLAVLAAHVLAPSERMVPRASARARAPHVHVSVHLRQGDACVSKARNRSCVVDFGPIAEVLRYYQTARRPPAASEPAGVLTSDLAVQGEAIAAVDGNHGMRGRRGGGSGTERLRVFLATESQTMIQQAGRLVPQLRTAQYNRSAGGKEVGRERQASGRDGSDPAPSARTRLTSDEEWHRAAAHLVHQYPGRSRQYRLHLLAGLQHDIEKVTPHSEKPALLQEALTELYALGSASELYIGEFFGGFARLGYVLTGGRLPYVSLDEVAFCCEAACTRAAAPANSFAAWLRAARTSPTVV